MNMLHRLTKMFAMAVWDNQGRQYLPVWGYDRKISNYARAHEAIEIFNRTWLEEEST